MLILKRMQIAAIILFVCAAILVSIGSAAPALQTDGGGAALQDAGINQDGLNGTGVVPGGPGFVMVSAYAFRPTRPDDKYDYNGGLYNPDTTTNVQFFAPVTLPHGATIKKFTAYFKDDSPEVLWVYLYRINGAWNMQELARVETAGEALAYRSASDKTIFDAVIDNQTFSYVLEVGFPAAGSTDLLLTNVRIDYGYDTAVPLILK